MKRPPLRVLPLEPQIPGEVKTASLSLPVLQRIEEAVLALLQAIRSLNPGAAPPAQKSPAIVDLANEFLISKARAQRGDRYLSLMIKQLRAFVRGREQTPAALITAAQIEHWLYSQDWAPKTKHGALLTLRTCFEFGVARSYLAGNPAKAVDLPILDAPAPGIHSPEEVRQVLARCSDPHTLRYLAIRYFAGLRGSEAEALSEEEIHVDRGFIEVKASKAKTRRRRLVKIEPNLAEWLTWSHERGGRLPLRQVNNRMAQAVKEAGVAWPQNVTRHSFVSYHLAQFQNAGKTALEAGHSEQMLFNHYRELVTLEEAAVFWAITPKTSREDSI